MVVHSLSTPAIAAPQITAVDLFPSNNGENYGEYGIGTFGQPIPAGTGLGGDGAVYAGNLLGAALDYAGMTFTFDAPYVLGAYAENVALPMGQDSSLTLLAAAVRANQPGQIFTVNYTDGSSTNFTQGISNINTPQNYPGESIATMMAYRLNADGTEHAGAYNVYAYTFALDPTKSVKSLTLPSNTNVFVLALDVIASAAPQVDAVTLFPPNSDGDAEYGIGTFGQPIPKGSGLDYSGAVYAGNLLGTALDYAGMTFTFDAPYVLAAYAESVALPATQDTSVTLLAAAARANQPNQIFTVNYTDGSSTNFTQGISNINTPQNYPGETVATTMAYRLNADGTEHAGAYNVYAYSFALDPTKNAKSLTLPDNLAVFVLAIDVTERSGPQVGAVDLFPSVNDGEYGIGIFGQPVPGGRGLDGGGAVYAENLLGTALNYAGMTFNFSPPSVLPAYAQELVLPAGQDTSLTVLATAVHANQPDQLFTVNYSDGTSTSFTQSISNINTPQSYAGEAIAKTMAYRLNGDGSEHPGAYNVYAYTFALDASKSVKSLTLPNNVDVILLAANITTAAD